MPTRDFSVYRDKDGSEIRLYMSSRCMATHHGIGSLSEDDRAKNAKNGLPPLFYVKVRVQNPEREKQDLVDVRYHVFRKPEGGLKVAIDKPRPRYTRVHKRGIDEEAIEAQLDAELEPPHPETGEETVNDIMLDDEMEQSHEYIKIPEKDIPIHIAERANRLIMEFGNRNVDRPLLLSNGLPNPVKAYDLETAGQMMVDFIWDRGPAPEFEDHYEPPKDKDKKGKKPSENGRERRFMNGDTLLAQHRTRTTARPRDPNAPLHPDEVAYDFSHPVPVPSEYNKLSVEDSLYIPDPDNPKREIERPHILLSLDEPTMHTHAMSPKEQHAVKKTFHGDTTAWPVNSECTKQTTINGSFEVWLLPESASPTTPHFFVIHRNKSGSINKVARYKIHEDEQGKCTAKLWSYAMPEITVSGKDGEEKTVTPLRSTHPAHNMFGKNYGTTDELKQAGKIADLIVSDAMAAWKSTFQNLASPFCTLEQFEPQPPHSKAALPSNRISKPEVIGTAYPRNIISLSQ